MQKSDKNDSSSGVTKMSHNVGCFIYDIGVTPEVPGEMIPRYIYLYR